MEQVTAAVVVKTIAVFGVRAHVLGVVVVGREHGVGGVIPRRVRFAQHALHVGDHVIVDEQLPGGV